MSSEALPPYSHNSDRLPPYLRLPEALASKPLPNHYATRSRRMALDLGQRYQSTRVPAFGREGLIEGHVWVQSFDHVEKVQVTLADSVASYFLEFGGPSRPSTRCLVNQTHEMWSARDEAQNIGKQGCWLAFAIVMPDHVVGTGDDSGQPIPLPPSGSINLWNACAHVAYTIRVDMIRTGWRSNDTGKTEILYLPRTMTHYWRPFMPLPNSEKLRPVIADQWAGMFVPQKSKALPSAPNAIQKLQSQSHSSLPQSLGDDIVVRLWLPDGLRYPAGRQILWSVTFVFPKTAPSTLNDTPADISGYDVDALLAGVSLRLVCVSTVALLPDTLTELGERRGVARGYLQSGEAEKDMSWGVSGLASVVGTDLETPVWEYSERIMITSHETDGEMHNAGVPALLLPGASRGSVPLSLMGL